MFDEKGNETLRKYNTHDVILRKLIFRYSPVAQPAAMIRRECFEKTGLYNTNYPPAEDIDMSFRIGCFYEFGNLPEKILKYRMLSTSATYQRLNKIERVTTQVRRQYFTHHKYKATLSDKLYNDLQILSISLIPPQLKIKIFNILRNS